MKIFCYYDNMVVLVVCNFKEYNSYFIVIQYLYNEKHDSVELRNINMTPDSKSVGIIQCEKYYNKATIVEKVNINDIIIIPLKIWTSTMLYFKHELTTKHNDMLFNKLNARHINDQRCSDYRIWNSTFTVPYTRDSQKLKSEKSFVKQKIEKRFKKDKTLPIYWHHVSFLIDDISYYPEKPRIMFTSFYDTTEFLGVAQAVGKFNRVDDCFTEDV